MDAEYLDEMRGTLEDAIEGVKLDSGEVNTLLDMVSSRPVRLDEFDIEVLAGIIRKAKDTLPPPRMMDEYEITHALHIGDREVVFGVADAPVPEHGNCPYLVSIINYKNPFDAPMPEKMTAYTGYVEALDAYHTGIKGQLDALKAERAERGDNPPFTKDHCIPGSERGDYTGKVVVFKADYLRPEYQYADYQLYLAQNGKGCNPDIGGRAIFATNLYTGEETRINRPEVLGVIQPTFTPEWASAKLAEIRAQQGRPGAEKQAQKKAKRGQPDKDAR